MKISGTYFLPVPQERAYQLLQDPEILARALPGCEGLLGHGKQLFRPPLQPVSQQAHPLLAGNRAGAEPVEQIEVRV